MLIQANSAGIAQNAATLTSRSQQCADLIRQIGLTMHGTATVWQGSDASAFVSQAESFQPQLLRLSSLMEQYALTLKNTAAVYDQLQQDRLAQAGRLL